MTDKTHENGWDIDWYTVVSALLDEGCKPEGELLKRACKCDEDDEYDETNDAVRFRTVGASEWIKECGGSLLAVEEALKTLCEKETGKPVSSPLWRSVITDEW